MFSFKDDQGHEWVLSLTIGKAKRIKGTLGIDLIGDEVGEILTTLKTNPFKRIEMMWALLEKASLPVIQSQDDDQSGQVAEHTATEDDFYDRLTGSTFERADAAFWQTIVFFIPKIRPIGQATLEKILEKTTKLTEMQTAAMMEISEGPELQEELEKAMEVMKTESRKEIGQLSSTLQAELESSRST